MNFNTVKMALYKKIKLMSMEDFNNFLTELKRVYYKTHKRNEEVDGQNNEY